MSTGQSSRVPIYRGLYLSVRPARVAVFFRVDKYWMATAQRMLENFSRIWGGAGNILIPCDVDGHVPDVFLQVLRAFDPDYLAAYMASLKDLKLRDPVEFKRCYDERRRELEGQGLSPELATQLTEGEVGRSAQLWELPTDMAKKVLAHCAPIHHRDYAFELQFLADCKPRWGLTDVATITANKAWRYREPDDGALDAFTRLMVSSRVGGISPSFKDQLSQGAVTRIDPQKFPTDDLRRVWHCCWLRSRKPAAIGGSGACWAWSGTPLGRTVVGCGQFEHLGDYLRTSEAFYVVVGDEATDYCLWLALDRMTDSAVWVPASLMAAESGSRTPFIAELARHVLLDRGYPGVCPVACVTSLSVEGARLDAFVANLRRTFPQAGRAGAAVKTVAPKELHPRCLYRFFEEETANVLINAPFVENTIASQLDTPLPHRVCTDPEVEMHWIVDVGVHGYGLPPRSALASVIAVGDPRNRPRMRCGDVGVSYPARRALQVGPRLDSNVVRPRFRLPDTHAVFGALLESHGLRVELSDKGGYTAAALDLWGGLNDLATDLLDEKRGALLSEFLREDDCDNARGVFLSGSKRRFLSFVDAVVAARLSHADARSMLDGYVEKGILSRGLILHCPTCKFTSWYGVDEVTGEFSCKRCRAKSHVVGGTWRDSAEPRWYYELAEVVYQALRHDARYPVLAVHALGKDSRAFQFVPELAIFKEDEPVAEIDVCVIRESQIIVGEAKKTGALGATHKEEKKAVAKLRRLSLALTADWVLFATGASEWRHATKDTIARGLRGSCLRPWFLEGIGRSPRPKSTQGSVT